jgi:hypothetical protein
MTAAERQRRWRANRSKAEKAKRRTQRRNAYAEKNEDAYFTCPEAVICLLHLERQYLPQILLEPCAGDGAISTLLQRAGYDVATFDIQDHGLSGCQTGDYLKLTPPPGIEGVATNPPNNKARQFLEKALADGTRYIALLVRTNFLFEAAERTDLLDRQHPPTRVCRSSTANDAQSGLDRQTSAEQHRLFVGGLGQPSQPARLPAPIQLATNLCVARMARLAARRRDAVTMETADIARLIAARCPELPASDVERIEVALSGEPVPASTLAVMMAVVEKIELRLIALETGTTSRLM